MLANYDLTQLGVLVVEDNPHMQKIMRAMLRGVGISNVTICADAATAYAGLAETVPDIAFVDLELAHESGITFILSVRRDPQSPNHHLPIVVVSANGDREHVLQARDAGATEFLVKPVSARSLYGRIAEVIDEPRPFVRTPKYVGPCRRRTLNAYTGLERRSASSKRLAEAHDRHSRGGRSAPPLTPNGDHPT